MRPIRWILFLWVACLACTRPPRLSVTSPYNVTSVLNGTPWFGTGKAIRLSNTAEDPTTVRQFNLQIITDIDFPGNSSGTKSPAVSGCIADCIPTQRLHIYNIPLKRGKYKLARLDKRRTVELEKTNYWLLIDGGGVFKNYQVNGNRAGWLRITSYNQQSNTLEGQFSFNLDEQGPAASRSTDSTEHSAHFRQGLFRVTLVDVKLK